MAPKPIFRGKVRRTERATVSAVSSLPRAVALSKPRASIEARRETTKRNNLRRKSMDKKNTKCKRMNCNTSRRTSTKTRTCRIRYQSLSEASMARSPCHPKAFTSQCRERTTQRITLTQTEAVVPISFPDRSSHQVKRTWRGRLRSGDEEDASDSAPKKQRIGTIPESSPPRTISRRTARKPRSSRVQSSGPAANVEMASRVIFLPPQPDPEEPVIPALLGPAHLIGVGPPQVEPEPILLPVAPTRVVTQEEREWLCTCVLDLVPVHDFDYYTIGDVLKIYAASEGDAVAEACWVPGYGESPNLVIDYNLMNSDTIVALERYVYEVRGMPTREQWHQQFQ